MKKELLQLMMYLTAANQMGGTYLGIVVVGAAFSRVLFVEDEQGGDVRHLS